MNDPLWIDSETAERLHFLQLELRISESKRTLAEAIVTVLCEQLENACSAMVDLGAPPALCELVEARGVLEWVKNLEAWETKTKEAMAKLKGDG